MKKMIMYGMVLTLFICCFAACGSVSSDSVSESESSSTETENSETENKTGSESEIQDNSEETEQEAAGDEGSESADNESVSMKFVELQEEASGLTAIFSIENSSDSVIYYGAEFTLEKSVDDAWESCDLMENADWNALLYELQPDETDDITVYIETYYGELTEGSYRITKTVYFSEDLDDDNATDISCIFDIT